MRIKLYLTPIFSNTLDYNYNYFMSGLIYKILNKYNPKFGVALHKSKKPKLFTFSQFFFKNASFLKDKIKIDEDTKITWYISSYSKEMVKSLIKGFLLERVFYLNGVGFNIKNISIVKFYNKPIFKSLSPILVSKIKNEKIYNLSPLEEKEEFFISLKKNLIKKYYLAKNKELSLDSFDIKALEGVKRKRIKIANTFHISYLFDSLIITGNREVREFAFDVGLGERNSMGFGMVG